MNSIYIKKRVLSVILTAAMAAGAFSIPVIIPKAENSISVSAAEVGEAAENALVGIDYTSPLTENVQSDGSRTYWYGDNAKSVDIDLNEDVVITGDLILPDAYTDGAEFEPFHKTANPTVNLNGHTLTVYGNILHYGGTLIIDGGTLNVYGNYRIIGSLNDDEGHKISSSASLYINDSSSVNIGGSLSATGSSAEAEMTKGGVLAVGGDIYSDRITNIWANGDGSFIFTGKDDQKITIEQTGTNSDAYYLGDISMTDPDKHSIIWNGKINFKTADSDLSIKSDNADMANYHLNGHDLSITGDIKSHGLGYLDGGNMTVNGDFIHSSGKLELGGGTLDVNGNYRIENTSEDEKGEIVYNTCQANLYMHEENDRVNISGDLMIHNNSTTALKNGVLSITGNIFADSKFSTSPDHKTLMTNSKPQKITFTDGGSLGTLELTQSISNYTFEPDYCWDTLICPGLNIEKIRVDDKGRVSWNTAKESASYQVGKIVNGVTYYGEKVTDTVYSLGKLPASNYQIFVTAMDERGNTSVSKTIDVAVEDPMEFVNDVTVDEEGKITWKPAENAVAYKVGKKVNGKTTYSGKLTDTSYELKKEPARDYEVFVVAFDKNGKSTWGKPTVVEVGSVGVAGDIKVKSNTVTWTAPRNAVSYKVGKTVNGKTTYSGKITDTGYEFKNVPTKDYQVFVVAFDEDGNKTYSEKKTVAVGDLGVVLNSTVKDNTVSWKPVRNAVEYKVGKVVDGKTYYSGKITDTSYKFKNTLKKDCQVFVVAFDKDGNRTFGTKLNVKAE